MFSRVVTHNDLDGVVSAALCAGVHQIDEVVFTGPNTISRKGYTVTKNDVVCDLPYPGECGLWFDHHSGNLEEAKRLGNDPEKLAGKFAPEKSCARVILEFYKDEFDFPDFYEETVTEVDKVDSFDYKTVEEWRRETPAKVINDSLRSQFKDREEEEDFLRFMISRLGEASMSEVAKDPAVQKRYQIYLRQEKTMISIIETSSYFYPEGKNEEYAIIDLTKYNKQTFVVRNLAQILFPDIRGVFLIQNLFEQGVKTNNFKISGSLTIKNNGFKKDIGGIMRQLNIGDGHAGAGSGQVYCDSKAEMEKKKKKILEEIYALWAVQH